MKIKGRISRLQERGSGQWLNVAGERSSQLKITTNTAQGIGTNGGIVNTAQTTGWEAQCVVVIKEAAQFAALWNSVGTLKGWRMITDEGTAYEGKAIVQKLSLSAGVKSNVSVTFGLLGSGRLEKINL